MNKPAWAAFWILGAIWGSSFLLIRVGVEDMSATQVVLIRTVIAAVGLNVVRKWRGYAIPRDWVTIRAMVMIGVGNATIPYTLISLSEQNISSGMAAVLQATASLFSLIIAHLAFADERINRPKVVGLGVGFLGVILLSSEAISGGKIDRPMLLGQLAMIGASLLYAIFAVYSRKVIRRNIEPIVVSSTSFIASAMCAVLFVILEPMLGGRAFIPFSDLPTRTVQAVLLLGFLNTFIAYLFFYFIIRELGAFRAVMVTYVVPVIGLILGVLVLSEIVTGAMLAGAAMILMGIAIINVRIDALFNRRSKAVETAS